MSLTQIIQNAVQLFNGQLTGGLVVLCLVGAAIYAMVHHHWGWFWSALGAAGFVVAAPWFVQTVYGVAG